jgi:hypothetical protein
LNSFVRKNRAIALRNLGIGDEADELTNRGAEAKRNGKN